MIAVVMTVLAIVSVVGSVVVEAVGIGNIRDVDLKVDIAGAVFRFVLGNIVDITHTFVFSDFTISTLVGLRCSLSKFLCHLKVSFVFFYVVENSLKSIVTGIGGRAFKSSIFDNVLDGDGPSAGVCHFFRLLE